MIKRCKGHAPVLRDLFPWPLVGIYLLLPAILGSATASMANRRAADKRERWFVYEVCVWSSGNSSNKS
jgi:hypothetical protein